ncbi:MAG: beta-glucosidase BglX [Pseudomonadota bacterium]
MDEATFVDSLLGRMSLAEKIGQLNLLSAGEGPDTGSQAVRDIRTRLENGQLGALFGTKSVQSVAAWQRLAIEGSRHAIPLLFAEDVIHGHRTVFPLPIGLACAWDPALWRDTARIAATEAAAEGLNQVYAPMVDIARDPRWGRVAESPGEDPFLAASYAEAMVLGLQGDNPAAPDSVIACLKHFIAYGAALGGRDYDNASLAPEDLIGVYAEPFRAGVAAGAGSVMAAFNAVNKCPMHAHRTLIGGWLRGRCGFDGMVVADYTGIHELTAHGIGDRETVAARALIAGVDQDMVGEDYLACLPNLAKQGITRPEAGVDIPGTAIEQAVEAACRRVLRLKHRLGLFDDPFRYCNEARAASVPLSPPHRARARQAVAESAVLLKNSGILPLAGGARVALVGPMADDRSNMLGTWAVSGDPDQAVTILEGLGATHDGPLSCCKGANIVDDPVLAERLNVHGPTVFLDDRSADAMIEEAVQAARRADVTVAVVGEAKEHAGESSSRTDLDLPAPQRRLIKALAETGQPLVLVVLAGRPLARERESALADAVLFAWFGGTEAGSGIADILTGRAEPGGRLAITLPARTGQVPVLHAGEPTGRPYPGQFQKFLTGYLDLPDAVPPVTGLYPFGFGLGYARFDWGAPELDKTSLSGPDDRATLSVTLTNKSSRRGSEVVQLYVSDPVARITRPLKELKGFEKVTLDPGEARAVSFTIGRESIVYPLGDSIETVEWVWDPGTFQLHIGPNSRDLQTVEIEWRS